MNMYIHMYIHTLRTPPTWICIFTCICTHSTHLQYEYVYSHVYSHTPRTSNMNIHIHTPCTPPIYIYLFTHLQTPFGKKAHALHDIQHIYIYIHPLHAPPIWICIFTHPAHLQYTYAFSHTLRTSRPRLETRPMRFATYSTNIYIYSSTLRTSNMNMRIHIPCTPPIYICLFTSPTHLWTPFGNKAHALRDIQHKYIYIHPLHAPPTCICIFTHTTHLQTPFGKKTHALCDMQPGKLRRRIVVEQDT